jgi:glucosamine-6-phosphate deaminase
MKAVVLIFKDSEEISQYAIKSLKEELRRKPNLVLGIPTGSTMLPIYKKIDEAYKKKELDFSKVRVFDIDEYLGLSPKQKQSFKFFLDKNLFKKVNIKEKNIRFLNGQAINIKKECENYEKEIKKAGGFDITTLGIGVNGHIAFNEPGSPFNSRTREVVLTYQTMKSNFGRVYSLIKAPKRALTIGIATILESKKIILIATGKHKAKPVKDMLEGPVDTKCPAAVLKNHKRAIFLLDKKAASLLKEKYQIYDPKDFTK